jgi:hypothetical protein
VVFAGALFDDAGSLQGVSVTTWIYSNARVDVLALVSGFLRFDEGQSAQGNALVRSVGIDPAQNVVYTIEVPSPAKLTRLALSIAAPGWTCAIVTPQRGRCMGSFEAGAPGATAWLGYVVSSDTAMTGNVTGTVTATDDGDATNDSASAQFEVLPALDAGISSSQPNLLIDANETTTVNVTLTTGRNAVPGVVLTVNGTFEVAIEEIRVGGVACTQLTSNLPPGVNPGCQLGDLAANVNLPVAVRYRAGPNEGQGSLYIGTSATRDSNYLNNSVSLPYMVQKQTDIGVATESASISANAGDPLTFPTITVTPADAAAHHVVLRIPLPSFATLGSVSAFNGGICTGTTTLECTFDTIPRGLSGGVQFSLLNASAGTFTSNITMTAGNDTTSANNATSVSVTVTAPTPPSGGGSSSSGGGGASSSSSSSSGGGKGGGRLEWIGLAFLALLVARRSGRRVEPTRHHSLH